MKFKHALPALAAVFALTTGLSACEVPEDGETAADRADVGGAASDDSKPKDDKSAKDKPEAPKETAAETQARKSAASYLDFMAFSRQGLIDQLVQFDDFSKKDATYGVDANKVDWNKQAALSAKQYLDVSAFSRQGLIDQLVQFDKYTPKQAAFGVSKVGL